MILRRVGSFWHDGAVVCLLGTIVRLFPSLANLNALEKKKLKWITDGVYSKKSMARVGLNVVCIPRWCSEKWQFFPRKCFCWHLRNTWKVIDRPRIPVNVFWWAKNLWCLCGRRGTRMMHFSYFFFAKVPTFRLISIRIGAASHEVSVWLTILTLLSSSW